MKPLDTNIRLIEVKEMLKNQANKYDNNLNLLNNKQQQQQSLENEIPVLDSSQTNEQISIAIHTKWKRMKLENLIIERVDGGKSTPKDREQWPFDLIIFVYLSNSVVYKYQLSKI